MTTKTEILFLELMYYMLSSGGRCAVIGAAGGSIILPYFQLI